MISIVANGKQFEQYEATNGMLFSLSCSAFWVGMLNAIQEICKERNIIKRRFFDNKTQVELAEEIDEIEL